MAVGKGDLIDIARAFKPNLASLGYGLFLAVSAAGVWGGVFPFLPASFQTPSIMFSFFLAESAVFTLTYFVTAVVAYRRSTPPRRIMVAQSGAPYLLGWSCLIGAIYFADIAGALATVGGALLGLGSAGFCMLWQRLFASAQPERGDHDLILGTVYGALFYFALYAIPVAVTSFLIPLVFMPLFGLAIVLLNRDIDMQQPMFAETPSEHPRVYRRAFSQHWRVALCVGALACCTGIMRSLAIADPVTGSLVNVLSMAAALVAGGALLVLWQLTSIRLNLVSAYRIAFPLIITSFLVLGFAPQPYERWLASALYALYSVAIVMMMVQCAQISRDGGINPLFIYGLLGGIVYAFHDVGFLVFSFADQIGAMGPASNFKVGFVAVYLLGLMYFVGQGGFRGALQDSRIKNYIEFIEGQVAAAESLKGAYAERQEGMDELLDDDGEGVPDDDEPKSHESSRGLGAEDLEGGRELFRDYSGGTSGVLYIDRTSKQVELMRRRYRLSSREAEVAELIVRGNSVSRIAEELTISENTVRTHNKRLYAKLGIHSKQGLRDLVDSFDPRDL